MRYLDPKNDLIFKRIFGEHKDLCISLLNSLLPLGKGKEITEIEYCSSELTPEIESLKNTIVDVRCIDKTGRQFIVEMQMYWTTSFQQRVLFNASKAYVRQLEKRQKYNLLEPVYTLALVNDNYTKSKEFYHHYKIIEVENTKQVIEGLEFVFVELEKFEASNFKEKKMMILWLRFLTEINHGTETIPEDLLNDPKIGKALETIEMSGFTQKELDSYDRYWDIIRTERTIYDDIKVRAEDEGMKKGLDEGMKKGMQKGMKRGLEKGLEKGMEKGLEKGLEEGMVKGIEKGLEEGIEKGIQRGKEEGLEEGKKIAIKNFILKMYNKSMTIDKIAEITNESIETIKSILENNKK